MSFDAAPQAFADTLRILPLAENRWAGEADPAYAHMGGRFGGYTAALLLKAVMNEPGERGDPLSLTVLYTDAFNDGPFVIATRLLRAGARLQFWRSELRQGDKVCAHAQATFGVRRDTLAFTDATMPEAPPPDDPKLVRGSPPAPFGEQMEARWITTPPFGGVMPSGPARSLFWTRHAFGHALDHAMLALLADFAPPRTMYRRAGFSPSSTVSMNVYFHATLQEIAGVGDAHVLSEVAARRSQGGYYDHALTLWSQSGALLVTSEQVAAFRD